MMPDIVLMVGNDEIDRINFGVVPVDSEAVIELDVFNKGKNKLLDINVKAMHEDIKVDEYPKELDVGEKKRMVLKYKPKVQLDKGVNSEILITGGYIV